jgi:hypothetical protein
METFGSDADLNPLAAFSASFTIRPLYAVT